MTNPRWLLELPQWLKQRWNQTVGQIHEAMEDRMSAAIGLAQENVNQATGGPFAATVYDMDENRCIAIGVNLVTHRNCSILHAEIVALMLAQQALGHYNFKACGSYELVTTTEPCAMCLGAIAWAAPSRLVCGARDADARAIGFDEGDKPPTGTQTLKRLGIEVITDVLRPQAQAVLNDYQRHNGTIY